MSFVFNVKNLFQIKVTAGFLRTVIDYLDKYSQHITSEHDFVRKASTSNENTQRISISCFASIFSFRDFTRLHYVKTTTTIHFLKA